MQGSTVMHQSRAGTLTPEEPDELIAHVRVCGGAGWVTTGSTRIIEVLSESTEAYDRGKKFEQYQSIEGFAEYLLIAQDHYSIERYVRQDERNWTYAAFRSLEEVVTL